MWNAIADRIERDPTCLSVPLNNIERWLKRGRVRESPLIEWRRRIVSAQGGAAEFDELINFLRAENHDSEPLKSCSPFVGILSREELDQCYLDDSSK